MCCPHTHFQVLIEETQLTKALEIMVLLPAAIQALWVASCFPAGPPIHEPPIEHKGATESAQ